MHRILQKDNDSRFPMGQVTLVSGIAFVAPLGPAFTHNYENGTLTAPPSTASVMPAATPLLFDPAVHNIGGELGLCTAYQLAALGRCLHAHSVGDFCIVGPKGVGKSFVVRAFSALTGYTRSHSVLICLYKDMTTRDLFEGRRTKSNGDTYWELSSLLNLAQSGGLAVLDGVEQIHPATLASLQRLVNDREVSLASGKRFMSLHRCVALLKRLSLLHGNALGSAADVSFSTPTEERLSWLQTTHAVYAIHPSFRIVALARPPLGNRGLERGSWMTTENCTIFPFVWIRPLLLEEEQTVLLTRAPHASKEDVHTLVQLAQTVRSPDADEIVSSIAESLSTRQLIRLCKQRQPMEP